MRLPVDYHPATTMHYGDVRSATSLAEAMIAMIEMPVAARSAMGAAGRAKGEREFALPEVTRRYRVAIAEALGDAPLSLSNARCSPASVQP